MKESTRSGDDVKATLHTEALKLANELEDWIGSGNPLSIYKTRQDSANMIRKLVEENEKLKEYKWMYEELCK